MRISSQASLLLLTELFAAWNARAQDPAANPPLDRPAALDQLSKAPGSAPTREHHFWDKENGWLFAGVGTARALDYSSTLNMRRRGRQEILLTNDVVDNHAAFAAIEVAGAATSIGASYLFHRYRHHSLERWVSNVHIGLTTAGAVRNYCLKTAHLRISP